MPKFNPDSQLNIHELVIEEPEKQAELPFDPERDIIEDDWEEMRGFLEGYRIHDARHFSWHAMAIKIINPKEDLELDKRDWDNMKEMLVFSQQGRNWSEFAQQASKMKLIDPEHDLGIDAGDWNGMENSLENNRYDVHRMQEFIFQAASMKILNPEFNLNINDYDWGKLLKYIDSRKKNNNWHGFSVSAAMMRIIDPNKDIGLDEEDWKDIRDSLYKMRGTNDFALMAMSMKILAAEDVKVTKNGLEINMRTKEYDLKQATSQMPEIKQF